MNDCKRCDFKSTCIGLFVGIIFGVVVGLVSYLGYIPYMVFGIWIALAVAAISLILLFVFLVMSAKLPIPSVLSYCLCQKALPLLIAAIGTIVFAALSLMAIGILFIIVIAIGAFFFGYLLTSIFGFGYCISCHLCPR